MAPLTVLLNVIILRKFEKRKQNRSCRCEKWYVFRTPQEGYENVGALEFRKEGYENVGALEFRKEDTDCRVRVFSRLLSGAIGHIKRHRGQRYRSGDVGSILRFGPERTIWTESWLSKRILLPVHFALSQMGS